ncbi:uncharacterized protein LOC129231560 [Uloborus diversus]|uniref:uncharacterized protein LOC129231560 n=1 Tax=Uloborus diversus TaxID=327109 RepID=UPI00240A66E9|nr:uncharacterized protein LOC129231560 [Uloborus diversus]XP_054721888.1 uncharacterized protein LOC129231560 [Uloborus diversus]XP_054721889.1 uncharacterized protein LOC129231560 [Uloborus diversus]XP_054721890.1 uncharacterized protein LOC129231560 [Uloborus diversus]
MRSKKRRLFQRPKFLFFVLIFCFISVVFYSRYFWVTEEIPFRVLADDTIRDFLINTPGCQIPAWSPWDASVKDLFKQVGSYKCSGQPSVLRIISNAEVRLEDAVLQYYYEASSENISCVFQEITRNISGSEKIDNLVILGKSKKLIFNQPLSVDFIKTTCKFFSDSEKEQKTFEEFLPLTPLKTDVEKRCVQHADTHKAKPLNVIFLGLDSISSLNFLRHFPKTKKYLSDFLSPISMKGYTKVGDNTFPNIMPLLTGHFYQHYYDEVHNKTMFFDDVDFFWKYFAKLGYRTLFAEDAPEIATFNYYRNGFKNSPADYYYRPFALAVEQSELKAKSKGQCFGSKMEMEVIYDYLKSFVDTMGKYRPFFAYVFLARLTHDVFNFAGYADEPTYQLIKNLHETGVLENTMLVFFSDHGIRYGPIRKTYIGQFEERMPFMHICLPKWFLEKNKELRKNLIINSERLSTPFDIHATMLHLASIISGDSGFESKLKPGISLFREIPANRTCSQARITPHWCPCQIHKAVPKDDKIVQVAAQTVIDTINNRTDVYRTDCAVLTLIQVLDARIAEKEKLLLNNSVMHKLNNDKVFNDYLIVLSSSPSNAIFEATVRCNESSSFCSVIDDISRINEYGKQSICISDAEIRKFCYCT